MVGAVGVWFMWRVKSFSLYKLLLPVTLILKLKSPEFVGVPERVADEERERPEGNVPEVLLHVYGVAPPIALNEVL